ncbi:hypothetical protein DN069_17435 [Streptacidiphilus pinicola]|uniref:Uncharacterized protein n=1 Tax=Streptacidiphilus pinicola TaxID=2219663 RepID=A0A2X0J249_9ACTN|nr:hypothetical protein [Streptacidiphilus pinicola]RAG84276.1 hypothetical protein DN069_17435 [Streptacidiphilus pinicola]
MPSADHWPPITLQRTGGFAGLKDTVFLDPRGAWTVTDRAGAQTTGELTAVQVAAVMTLAADPQLASEAGRTPAPSRCTDAYHYILTVGTARISYADCPADPDQPVASMALVRQLLYFAGLAPA